jgi:hypothetical protein
VSLTERIAKTKELLQWIDNKIYGLEYEVDEAERSKIAMGCFFVSRQHCGATVLLIELKQYTSANALRRLILEALIRGEWFFPCATDEDMKKFKESKELKNKKIWKLVKAIEETLGDRGGIRSEIINDQLQMMHDFAHTGYHQLEKQFSGDDIEPTYTEDEVGELLNFTYNFALITTGLMAEVADNTELRDNTASIIHGRNPMMKS